MSLDPQQAALIEQDLAAAAQLTRELVSSATEAAVRVRAETKSGAEAKDWAQAAFTLSQAIVILDPTRLAGGDTPEARAASVPLQDGDQDGRIGE